MKGKKVSKRQEEIEKFFEENAVLCPQGMKIVSLVSHSVRALDVEAISRRYKKTNVFNYQPEVISVIFDGKYYLLPTTQNNIDTLLSFGIIHSTDFDLNLKENDYPEDKENMKKWMELLTRGAEARKDEFMQACKKRAIKNGIKPVPNKELANCLEIPEVGLRVKIVDNHFYDEETTYQPIVKYLAPDSITHVGTYSTYNGKVIFVNYDGKTYLSKGTHIVNVLNSLNYAVHPYYVPFSNTDVGLVIVDKELRKQWGRVEEIND